MQLTGWIWALLAATVSTIYFFLIKYYRNKQANWILLTVVCLELVVIYLYYKSLAYTSSGLTYAIINALSVLLGVGIAFVFFREQFGLMDLIGLGAIITGIVLVGRRKYQQ